MATKKLVIFLVGRIVVVTKGADTFAVFLNAEHERQLHLRKHTPLLSVPMSMVASQRVADQALVASGTFVQVIGRPEPLMDSMGVWPLSGYDMTIRGVAGGTGTRQIDDLSDLNGIVAKMDPSAQFDGAILKRDPGKRVLARLKVPRAANITGIVEDDEERTFVPGGHKQKIATYVKCEVTFASDLADQGPALALRAFRGGRRATYKLSGEGYREVNVMMSNLCNCFKQVLKPTKDGQIDDLEFGIYYGLLREPRPDVRPLPRLPIPKGKLGGTKIEGVRVPECYDPARLKI
jgi:hypothetical protein